MFFFILHLFSFSCTTATFILLHSISPAAKISSPVYNFLGCQLFHTKQPLTLHFDQFRLYFYHDNALFFISMELYTGMKSNTLMSESTLHLELLYQIFKLNKSTAASDLKPLDTLSFSFQFMFLCFLTIRTKFHTHQRGGEKEGWEEGVQSVPRSKILSQTMSKMNTEIPTKLNYLFNENI